MGSTQIDLTVVIVNWNTSALLRNCLESVFRTTSGLRFEVIVVDNGSADDSVDMLRREFPQVRTIFNVMNRGFAAANNQGIAASDGRYVLLLNSDTVVQREALHRLVTFADANPFVGIVGPRLLNADGSHQPSWAKFPTVTAELMGRNLRVARPFRGSGRMPAYDVDSVGGACMLVSRSAFDRAGPLDEAFFMYSEEIDLCYRVKAEGLFVAYLPSAEVVHYGGQSARVASRQMKVELYRSKLVFFRKHYGSRHSLELALLLGLGFGLRTAIFWLLCLTGREQGDRWHNAYLDASMVFMTVKKFALTQIRRGCLCESVSTLGS